MTDNIHVGNLPATPFSIRKDPYLMAAYLDGGCLVAAKGTVGPLEVRAADTYSMSLYRPYERSAGDKLPAELVSAARIATEHGRNLIFTFPRWRKVARWLPIGLPMVTGTAMSFASSLGVAGWPMWMFGTAMAASIVAAVMVAFDMWRPFEPKLYQSAHQLRGWKVKELDRASTGVWRAAVYMVQQGYRPDSLLPLLHGLAIEMADLEDEIDTMSGSSRYLSAANDVLGQSKAKVTELLAQAETLMGRRILGHERDVERDFRTDQWAAAHTDQPANLDLNPDELR